MEIELKREQLQSRLDAILVAAAAADAELTQAIKMASGKQPIPAQPSGQGNEGGGDTGQAGQPVNKQSGTAPRSSTEFLNQWQDALTQPGPAGSSDPRTTQAPPALDPKSPAGRAAADQMRRMLEAQGVPAGQIDARIADIFQRSQQPLPASPKPEPPTKQPAPGIGEQLGNAFNDFTNDVNEGFYDRADQTLNTVENLTGTGGEGHPGVVESWKQMMIDNAKQALVDPVGVAGPGNPLSAFSAAAHDIPEAINNPGHYMGEKLFDGTAMAATIPLGGEGALGRSLMPEMSALEHGALPGVGALTHEAVPGIPHNVIDLPPTGEHPLSSSLGGNHELPPAPMDTRGHHPAAGDQPIAHPAPDGLDHQ
ncbi:MAG: hypothetical protein QOK02_2863, partial [Mycobacterium sp.]|nr:hypothetical protein [Mycobacterium sp.]